MTTLSRLQKRESRLYQQWRDAVEALEQAKRAVRPKTSKRKQAQPAAEETFSLSDGDLITVDAYGQPTSTNEDVPGVGVSSGSLPSTVK